MGPEPAITVVIPVVDRIEFLGAALASVREQTMSDFEVVVVDAGSVEPIPDLVRAIAADDPRFRLVSGGGPLAAPEARTMGLEHARAPLVVTLDCDDLMAPRRLELQATALAADPELVCVSGRMRPIDVTGAPVPVRPSAPPAPRPAATDAEIRWRLPFSAPSLASSMAFRADALRAIGGFDHVHGACDDYSTVWLLSQRGRLLWLSELMADYRRHGGQLSWGRRGEQEAQLLLLRRAIVSERLGRTVPLATVAAMTRSRLVAAAAGVDDAVRLCDELLERFLDGVVMTDAEREWVVADHARQRDSVARRAASP